MYARSRWWLWRTLKEAHFSYCITKLGVIKAGKHGMFTFRISRCNSTISRIVFILRFLNQAGRSTALSFGTRSTMTSLCKFLPEFLLRIYCSISLCSLHRIPPRCDQLTRRYLYLFPLKTRILLYTSTPLDRAWREIFRFSIWLFNNEIISELRINGTGKIFC